MLWIPVALSDCEQYTYDQCSRVVRRYIARRREEQPRYRWQGLCGETGAAPAARHAMKAYHLKEVIENRCQEKLRVLEDIFRLHVGQKTIVFTGSNEMAMAVSRRFWILTILSHTPKCQRLAALDGFADGAFQVLVADRVPDEGIDVPDAKVAVVPGGQGAARQARQRLGRVLRKSGTARAVLYEVVCENTKDVRRSRNRRRSDAFANVKRTVLG